MSDQALFSLEKILAILFDYRSLTGPPKPYVNDVLTLIVGEPVTRQNRVRVLRHAQIELRRQWPWLRTLRLPKFESADGQKQWLEALCELHDLRKGLIAVLSSPSWRRSI